MSVIDSHKAKQKATLSGADILDAMEALNHCASDIVDEPAKSRLRHVSRALQNLFNREIGSIIRD